jgi:BirA family biotin operon repressor/biotin-[acetyl-CoA-carboxylase] ligase
VSALGAPHLHLRETSSTNDRARTLALAGAPHGTLVTAGAQTAGRGRQGRTWSAPPGRALLMSLVLREPHELLPLAAAVAVARTCGDAARVKWPNDVQLAGRKVAGILAEGRPQEGWAVLGIGLNVAVRPEDLPEELRATAAGLGRRPDELPAVRTRLLEELAVALALPRPQLLGAWRERDALRGHPVRWRDGSGTADGIDAAGRLLVLRPDGTTAALDAGEVHLERPALSQP